jgi:UDP-N-acetylglucosamine/UDP-N-acetylgalactosamine 4-epimerase
MYEKQFHLISLSEKSVLVTGGAGFIGSNLVEYLIKYNVGKVRVLDNLSTGFLENLKEFLNDESFEFIEGDIRDLDTCQKACYGMDYVLHQAALGSVPRSINDPITTNEVNIAGFLNILVAARDQKVNRVVYAASSSTYGDSKDLPKIEDNIGKPLSPYAVTKYVNELYADIFNKVYSLETIGLRYFNVFGPKQSPNGEYAAVIPLFIKAALENTSPFINGNGEQTRDFTFVENAIQANIKAMLIEDPLATNEVYNVACGDRTSLNTLWRLINSILNVDIPATYRNPRNGDISDSLANIEKIKQYLNYEPTVRLESGLKILMKK